MKRFIYLKLSWAALLLCFSSNVFSDTYSAVVTYTYSGYTSTQLYCDANFGTSPVWMATTDGTTVPYGCRNPANNNDVRYSTSNKMSTYNCPSGGTLSGTNCINVPACTSPQVRQTVSPYSCTNPPIIACPSGQYAPLGSSSTASCVAVPNCNSTSPTDGKYFDINTVSCVTQTGATMCLTGVSVAGGAIPVQNYYCPPVSDCLPVTQACSNNAINVQAASNARAAEIAAIKASADAKKAQADTSAASAAASKIAKDNTKAAALAAQTAAKQNSDAVAAAVPAATPSQLASSSQVYSASVTDFMVASVKAANSLLAAAAAQTAAGDAMTHTDSIPAENPGNGAVYNDMVSNDLSRAIVAAGDAASGLGSGTGTGQGASSGTCVATGTCTGDLAKEGTLNGIKDALAKDTVAYSATPGVRTIGDSFGLVSAKFSSHLPSVVFSDVQPECPVFTRHIPFINVDLVIDQFCTLDQYIRPTLQAVSLFIYMLLAFLIILRA